MAASPDGSVELECIGEADVRSMVRLLSDAIAHPGTLAQKRLKVMEGLCQLVDADAWAWSLVHMEAGRAPMQVALLHDGIPEDRFVRYVEALEHPGARQALEGYVGEAISRAMPLTRRDGEIMSGNAVDYDAYVEGKWSQAGLGSFMLTAWPLQAGGFSGIGVYRSADRPLFGARESRIAHIMLTEIPWLHEERWDRGRSRTLADLPRRQREILQLQIQGWSRKEISHALGITLNTVHGYLREIYRHFEVASHAGLMRHFGFGDGECVGS